MATMAEVEQALTALLLAGKELGATVASDHGGIRSIVRSLRSSELKASLAHRHAREVIEAFANRSYETGLELGRQSALKASR